MIMKTIVIITRQTMIMIMRLIIQVTIMIMIMILQKILAREAPCGHDEAEKPPLDLHDRGLRVRPISVLRFSISEGLTQA